MISFRSIPILLAIFASSALAALSPLGNGQDDSAQIGKAIVTAQATSRPVYLNPGVFTVAHSIEVDGSPVTVQGSGPATILRRTHNANDYWDAFFTSQNGVKNLSLEDLTVDGSQTNTSPIVLNAWGACPGLDVGRVNFIWATAPYARQTGGLAGANVHDCHFTDSMADIFDGQTYSRDIWDHPCQPWSNECIVTGANINLDHLEFNETERGIIFRAASNVTGNYLRFIDIAGGNNSGELLLAENATGPGLNNSNISNVTAIGCDSAIIEDGSKGSSNNTFTHVNADGRGIFLAGIATNNKFSDVQLNGGIVQMYATAQQNNYDGLAIVNPHYSQFNERMYMPTTPFMLPQQAIIGTKGNAFTNSSVFGLPKGWDATDAATTPSGIATTQASN